MLLTVASGTPETTASPISLASFLNNCFCFLAFASLPEQKPGYLQRIQVCCNCLVSTLFVLGPVLGVWSTKATSEPLHIDLPLFIFFYQILDLAITRIKVTNPNISFSAYSQSFFQVVSSSTNTMCVCTYISQAPSTHRLLYPYHVFLCICVILLTYIRVHSPSLH